MDNMFWKDIYFKEKDKIYDYRNLYQVSNDGKVRSLDRVVIEKGGKEHFIKGRYLKPYKDKNGYNVVTLCINQNKKRIKVAKLVAHMFCNGYEDGLEVDHIIPISDGGGDNANNLRWTTHKENINNKNTLKNKSTSVSGEKHPLYGKKGENNPKYNKGEKKIVQLDENFNVIKIWNGSANIERELGINRGNLVQHCRGNRQKTCGGYKWMYKEYYDLFTKLNEYYKFDNKGDNKYE